MALVWAVNGAKFTADSARAETFKNTSGGRGVTLPGDMKVTALPTPGAFVRVASGGATFPAGYTAAPGQSYGTYMGTSQDVAVTATGSGSAVTKYLIQRVTDPQYEGSAPADPVNAVYDSFAWVSTLTGLNYPYVPLVKLVQPASTATITNAMLTDIRRLARPRRERVVRMSGPTPEQSPWPTGDIWPNYRPTVFVPEWATHISMVVHLASVGHRDGDVEGQITATIGYPAGALQLRAANAGYDLDLPTGAGERNTFVIGGAGPIPTALRGTDQVLGTEANKTAGAGKLVTVTGTQVIFDVEFYEDVI